VVHNFCDLLAILVDIFIGSLSSGFVGAAGRGGSPKDMNKHLMSSGGLLKPPLHYKNLKESQ